MISVVMPSFLGYYDGAATNRKMKLHRAIDSFVQQGCGELIIVADGCELTMDIASQYKDHAVRALWTEKKSLFSGELRNIGIREAVYPIVCYLDSDDTFGKNHLHSIVSQFTDDKDWVFWDDYLGDTKRDCLVSVCRIGTSCIAHKKDVTAKWPDGYNHDWKFIAQLGDNYMKIDGTSYIVRHVPGRIDQ